jgi:DNA-binding response OmpR family regulator
MATKKVFLVQEDVQLSAVVTSVLNLEGFTVETTSRVECILSTASAFQPDIIVLDDLLQQQNTMPICKQLKSQQATRDVPVIVVSSHPHEHAWTHEAQANGVLSKPVSFFDLLDTLQSFIA